MARSARRAPSWQQLQRSHWRTAIPAQAGHCRCGWFAQKRDVLLSPKTSTIPPDSLLEPGSMNGHMMPLNKTLLPYFKARLYYFKLISVVKSRELHEPLWLPRVTVHADNPLLIQLKQMANFPLALVRQECPQHHLPWEKCMELLLQPRRRRTTSPPVICLRGEFSCCHPSTELGSLGGCIMLLASGLTSQTDHLRAFQITTAAGTSADTDCAFFLWLTKVVLLNDCQMGVLQPAASPKDSHKP